MEPLNQQPGCPELTPDQPDDAADRRHGSEEPGWQSLRPDLLDRVHDPEAPWTRPWIDPAAESGTHQVPARLWFL